jgi:hypothetical protein
MTRIKKQGTTLEKCLPEVQRKGHGRNNSADQLQVSMTLECVNQTNGKLVYLKPKEGDKIDAFFNYYKQESQRQFEINTLAVAIEKKFSPLYGLEFSKSLFDDLYFFTKGFTCDIVSKVDNGIEFTDISYLFNGSTVTRYLVEVENNVLSIFRHFFSFAKATRRESVLRMVEKEEQEKALIRANNVIKRREERETEKVGQKIINMDATKLFSMLSNDQIAALAALAAGK